MTNLDLHQNAHEYRFAHDELFRFRVNARSARLFGLWVGKILGLAGDGLEDYASRIMSASVTHAHAADILDHLASELARREIMITKAQLIAHQDTLREQAKAELTAHV